MSRFRIMLLPMVFAHSAALAGSTIFTSGFSGTNANLNGQTPDNVASLGWVASPVFNANGSIEASGQGSATLAFSPVAGNVYTLDASFRNMTASTGASTPNEDDWFALGFASGQSAASDTNSRFVTGTVTGTTWMFTRGSTTSAATNNALLDGTSDVVPWSSLSTARAGDMDMRIVLDTSNIWASWTATWYARRPTDSAYTKVRNTTNLLSTAISSVGIAKSGNGVAGTVTHFSLSSENGSVFGTVPANQVKLSTIGPAFGASNINGTSFARNNIVTVGDQQFVAYYEPDTAANDGYDGHVVIARRTIGSSTWQLSETNFLSNNISDNHDIISIAVDGDGVMHLSWGMHANQGGGTNYVRSTGSVLTPGSPISFTSNLGSSGMTGNETNVTYPEFLKLADGDLLFFYRNGTSGNGDLRLNRYDTATDTWSVVKKPLVEGISAGVNAYWNTPTIDSQGKLHLSWLFRENASTLESNHDLYYAVSSDNGLTWKKDDGSAYIGTINKATSDRVVEIPENYSYINQTSMTVDQNDRPIVASRWAPEAGSGNSQTQQMLEWFDGTDWHVSQITQFEPGANSGRRPAVLVDEDGRVLVLIGGSQLGGLVMAYSMDRVNWQFLDMGVADYGLEPTYDLLRWQRDGVISMLVQPVGGDTETLQLFEFDARAYFASVPEPASLAVLGLGGMLIGRRQRRV